MKSHLLHLANVLETLERNKLFAKKSKCHFACIEIEYLGHLISKDRVRPNPKKLDSMISWPIAKNVKSLRDFLGLIGFYRKFIKGYGQIVAHLTTLLKKDEFEWSLKAASAFEQLK